MRDVDAVAAQALDDLVQPVAQVLLISRERAGLKARPGPDLAALLAGLTALLALLTHLALLPLLALLALLTLLALLALLSLLALLALLALLTLLTALALLTLLAALVLLVLSLLVALGAEGPVEQLTLPPHQVGQTLDGLVLRVLLLVLPLLALLTLSRAAGHHAHVLEHLHQTPRAFRAPDRDCPYAPDPRSP